MSLFLPQHEWQVPLWVCVQAINSVTSMKLESLQAYVRCISYLIMLGGNPSKAKDTIECLRLIAEKCRLIAEGGEQ